MFKILIDTLMGSVKQEIWSPILNLLDKKYEAKKYMTPALNKQGRFIEFGSIIDLYREVIWSGTRDSNS